MSDEKLPSESRVVKFLCSIVRPSSVELPRLARSAAACARLRERAFAAKGPDGAYGSFHSDFTKSGDGPRGAATSGNGMPRRVTPKSLKLMMSFGALQHSTQAGYAFCCIARK